MFSIVSLAYVESQTRPEQNGPMLKKWIGQLLGAKTKQSFTSEALGTGGFETLFPPKPRPPALQIPPDSLRTASKTEIGSQPAPSSRNSRPPADVDPIDKNWPTAARPVSRLHMPAWKTRFDHTRGLLAHNPFDLIWLGDSIVQQFERDGPEPWQNYRAVWDKYYKPRNAINLGFAGDDTTHLIWRLLNGHLENPSARLIIISIGTNNLIRQSFDAHQTVAAIERIVGIINKRLPNAKILLLSILPNGQGTWTNTEQKKANDTLQNRFASSTNVVFADVSHVFIADGQMVPSKYRDILQSPPQPPTHPHADAQAQIAEAIEPAVSRVLGPLQLST